ncbi:MAG: hypothetical protein PHU75_00085 [Candidatus Nanopelagicales bacterium]|nr:hypothetical protein [Candidatus Nanopelagicales bacterium]
MRISRTLAVSAAAVALIAGAIAPAANAADTVVPNAQWSLGLAPEVTTSPGVQGAYIRLWDMKTAWRDINPAPGQFDFSIMDQRVAQVEAAGAKPLIVLGLTPQWAAADPSAGDPRWGAGTASAPANISTYVAYVTAIMQHYGSRVGAIEVWNEANLKTFWTGTPGQMADLTAAAYKAIKSISPGTAVIAASSTTRLFGSVKNFFGPYAAAVKKQGYPIDGWTIHTYPAGNQGPADRYQQILEWQGVLKNATDNDPAAMAKQVWDTEINYGLAGPGAIPKTDFDANGSSQYVARTFVDSQRIGIDATFWYMWTASSFSLLGIQMFTGTTPSITAYNTTRSWLVGATFKGCDTDGNVLKCFFTKNGEAFFLGMSKNDTPVSYSKAATLNVENWIGQATTPAGTVSLGTGPQKFTCPGADKSACTFGAAAAAGATTGGAASGSGATAAKSITIRATKGTFNGKKAVIITGKAVGMEGEQVTPFVKLKTERRFTALAPVTVGADGSFTAHRNTSKIATVYVVNNGVQSNTVTAR